MEVNLRGRGEAALKDRECLSTTGVRYPHIVTAEADFLSSSLKTKPLLLQRQTQTVILGSSATAYSPTDTCHHGGMACVTSQTLCMHTHTLLKIAKSHRQADFSLLLSKRSADFHTFPCRFSRIKP